MQKILNVVLAVRFLTSSDCQNAPADRGPFQLVGGLELAVQLSASPTVLQLIVVFPLKETLSFGLAVISTSGAVPDTMMSKVCVRLGPPLFQQVML